ncbi:MAG: deoxyhypusine synthase [Thermoplasmatota archaeon]
MPGHERADDVRKHLEPITDIQITSGMSARALGAAMHAGGGFSAKNIAIASEIVKRLRAPEVTSILSFPAALMATGVRGVLTGLVRDGFVDAVITTCGTLDHDLARTWRDYYHGSFGLDDASLHQQGVNRLGNILVPNESYGEILEEKLRPWLAEMYKEKPKWATWELAREFGRRVASEERGANSFLAACAKHDVPVFVPGPTDGAVGAQLWLHYQQHRDFTLDLFADEQKLSDLTFSAPSLGALMIGGGISKHHTIWWSQFRGGLDYAVYITTAVEHDGSLSGARLEEAISWGKLKEDARFVNLEGDASALLPMVVAGAV